MITDADMKVASVDLSFEGVTNLRLTEAGADKIIKVTCQMRLGHDRLAIIVEGKLISAPVVKSQPGASIMIEGIQVGFGIGLPVDHLLGTQRLAGP